MEEKEEDRGEEVEGRSSWWSHEREWYGGVRSGEVGGRVDEVDVISYKAVWGRVLVTRGAREAKMERRERFISGFFF